MQNRKRDTDVQNFTRFLSINMAIQNPYLKKVLAQLCPTLCNLLNCSLPDSSGGQEFSRQEYWSWQPFPFSGYLPKPGFPGDSDGKNQPAMEETQVQSLGWETPWRRGWLPTSVFLPGEFQGKRSLFGYSPWGPKESDTTEQFSLLFQETSECYLIYSFV